MNRLTIGSIVTATLLLVGCGSGNGSGNGSGSNESSSTPSSSLTDSSTPTNTAVENPVVAQKNIGKGFYVDSAVEGVTYQCGNESGVTDENGTFTFEGNSDCNFTIGGINLRDINASLLEDNITILETNTTIAQLLQTLDSDGNASNGIQISQSSNSILRETLSSLDDLNQDLLEAVHGRLTAEHSNEYNGTVVDRNKTVEHLNATKADLRARRIRTNLDIEAEYRGRTENNDTNSSVTSGIDMDNTMGNMTTNREEEGRTGSNNSSSAHVDSNMTRGNSIDSNINASTHVANNMPIEDRISSEHSGSNRDENISPRDTVADSFGDMTGRGEDKNSERENPKNDRNSSQEHSGSFSTQGENSTDSSMISGDTAFSSMGNYNSSDGKEEGERSDNASRQNENSSDSSMISGDTTLSSMGNYNSSDGEEEGERSDNASAHNQSNSSNRESSSSSSSSVTGAMGGFGGR